MGKGLAWASRSLFSDETSHIAALASARGPKPAKPGAPMAWQLARGFFVAGGRSTVVMTSNDGAKAGSARHRWLDGRLTAARQRLFPRPAVGLNRFSNPIFHWGCFTEQWRFSAGPAGNFWIVIFAAKAPSTRSIRPGQSLRPLPVARDSCALAGALSQPG